MQIKFRAWDELNKVMHYDFQFIRSGEEGNDWIVFTSDKQTLQSNPHPLKNPYFQQQLKIMQFTGLNDYFKKEIFEGDILELACEYDRHRKGIVDFKDGRFIVRKLANRNDAESLAEILEAYDTAVIIGNTFENPDLLPEGKPCAG